MVIVPQSPQRLAKRLLGQVAIASTLSAASLLLGWVPSVHEHSIELSSAAYAQAVSDSEVNNYAASLREIEPLRQSAYSQIKDLSGTVPAIACHRPSSLSNLDENIRPIAVNYCNQAISIVERHDLTIVRFNEITIQLQSDPELERRIQRAL